MNAERVKIIEYLQILTRNNQTDQICQFSYAELAKYPNGVILSSINIMNGLLILILNIILLNGLCKSRRNQFTRNEKLVLLLSFIDIVVALVHIPLEVYVIKNLNQTGCLTMSVIGFWMAFPLAFSGSIVVLISIERFIAIFNDKKCCGFHFKIVYLIPIVILHFIISFGLGVWYALLIYLRETIKQQSAFFFCIAAYTICNLISVLLINISLLIGTRKKLRNKQIHVAQHAAVEKRLTQTMALISISLIVFYLPFVGANFYLSTVLYSEMYELSGYAIKIVIWCLALCELNSAFNAFIYVIRNKRILQIYRPYIRLVIDRTFSITNLVRQASTTDTLNTISESFPETNNGVETKDI